MPPRTSRASRPGTRGSLSIGIGDAIALADEAIVNEHITPDELADAALSIAAGWMKPVGS